MKSPGFREDGLIQQNSGLVTEARMTADLWPPGSIPLPEGHMSCGQGATSWHPHMWLSHEQRFTEARVAFYIRVLWLANKRGKKVQKADVITRRAQQVSFLQQFSERLQKGAQNKPVASWVILGEQVTQSCLAVRQWPLFSMLLNVVAVSCCPSPPFQAL